MAFFLYILKCADEAYYVGHTDNLEYRISQHSSGEVKGYTSKRLPVTLVFSHELGSRDEALQAERQIKKWTRKKKEALIAGDWNLLKKLALKNFN